MIQQGFWVAQIWLSSSTQGVKYDLKHLHLSREKDQLVV